MTTTIWSMLAVAALATLASPAGAQTATPPRTTPPQPQPRPVGGWFGGLRPPDPANPDRTEQQLSLRVNLGGGADENGGPFGNSVLDPNGQQAGYIRASGAELAHRWGNSRNYLESSARGYLSIAEIGIRQQTTADAVINSGISFGRRAGMTTSVGAAYQPTYLFNAFNSIAPEMETGVVPGAEVTQGFTEERWLATQASASVHRNWTTRQRTELIYAASKREPLSRGFESKTQAASIRHDWAQFQHATIQGSYQFDENQQADRLGRLVPINSHRAALNLRMQKRLSPDRSLAVSVGGGATQSRTRPSEESGRSQEYLVPSWLAGLQWNMSAKWMLSMDGNRNVTVLDGVAGEPFVTDAAVAMTEGNYNRVRITGSVAYSHGDSASSRGAFEMKVALAQATYTIKRCCAVSASYQYYDHHLFDLSATLPGFPPRYRRHSLRAGLNLWLPLFGSF